MNRKPGLLMMGDGGGCLYFDGSWLMQSVASFLIRVAAGMTPNRDPQAEVKSAVRGFHGRTGSLLLWSLDAGMHTGGFWKNPDYDRCRHLSISYHETDLDLGKDCGRMRQVGPKDARLTGEWIDCFFGGQARWLWCEPAVTEHGRRFDVWHYRLFCDERWQPIKPQGELYGREQTERGWKSWSDVSEERRRAAQREAEREAEGKA